MHAHDLFYNALPVNCRFGLRDADSGAGPLRVLNLLITGSKRAHACTYTIGLTMLCLSAADLPISPSTTQEEEEFYVMGEDVEVEENGVGEVEEKELVEDLEVEEMEFGEVERNDLVEEGGGWTGSYNEEEFYRQHDELVTQTVRVVLIY